MEKYPSNAHRSTGDKKDTSLPEKKVTKVTTKPVVVKKKTELQKFTEGFLAEDWSNIKSFIYTDVIIPALKDTIWEVVTKGLNMCLGFDPRTQHKGSGSSRISYDKKYRGDDPSWRKHSDGSSRPKSVFDVDRVVIPDRGEAEEVLLRLDELIETYGQATVGDFYELVGITTSEYTTEKYGWKNVRDAYIARISEGYIIKLPKVIPLN